jgi:uncharacterized protein YbjT (DUF2867 family)
MPNPDFTIDGTRPRVIAMSTDPVCSPIAVLGGSRGTGTVVAALARAQGREARVVETAGSAEVLRSATDGVRAIIHIPARGVRSLADQVELVLQAHRRPGRPRPQVVLVTGFSVGHGLAHAMNTREFLQDRQRAEALLRIGGLPYTIIRPTWLTSDPPGHYAIRLSQDPLIDGMIARADLAAVCLAACDEPRARNTTFAIFAEPGEPPDPWSALFSCLVSDRELAK